MAKKYKVIAGGIFGNGKEIPVGEVISFSDEVPEAWKGRVIEVEVPSSTEGKEPVVATPKAEEPQKAEEPKKSAPLPPSKK